MVRLGPGRLGGDQRPHGGQRVEQEMRLDLRLQDPQRAGRPALLRPQTGQLVLAAQLTQAPRLAEVAAHREAAPQDAVDERQDGEVERDQRPATGRPSVSVPPAGRPRSSSRWPRRSRARPSCRPGSWCPGPTMSAAATSTRSVRSARPAWRTAVASIGPRVAMSNRPTVKCEEDRDRGRQAALGGVGAEPAEEPEAHQDQREQQGALAQPRPAEDRVVPVGNQPPAHPVQDLRRQGLVQPGSREGCHGAVEAEPPAGRRVPRNRCPA